MSRHPVPPIDSFPTRVVDDQVSVMLSNIHFECRGKSYIQTCAQYRHTGFVSTYITICITHDVCALQLIVFASVLIHVQDLILTGGNFSYWDDLFIYNLLSSDCVCTSRHQGTVRLYLSVFYCHMEHCAWGDTGACILKTFSFFFSFY